MKYRCTSQSDPNYFFEIEATDEREAIGMALSYLGWSLPCSDSEPDDETDDEDEG